VSGNGQRELVEALAGLRTPVGGEIRLEDEDITSASAYKRWQLGLGYIPADRNDVGSIADFSLVENTTMNYYFDERFLNQGTLNYKKIRKLTEDLIAEYDVKAPNAEVKAKNLSGGNLQKIILARVLSRNPKLVIADLPTQGLDIGAIEFVRNKLVDAKKEKAGVLLISEDLDEIFALCDWIAPIYEGKLKGIIPREYANREYVGALMAGTVFEGAGR
jgi:simple sugar transport system ATP-binding protein